MNLVVVVVVVVNRRNLARLIEQYRDIFSNISEGTAVLLHGVLCNTLKKEGRAFRNIGKYISLYCLISLANFRLSGFFICL